MDRRRLVASLAASLLLLAACGGGEDGGGGAQQDGTAAAEPTRVTVGVIPIIDVAPLHLGLEQGFFEEEGLELEISTGEGGAAIVPGVVGGSYDFGFGNSLSLVVGASTGLPLQVVASGVYGTGDPAADPFALVTADDSLQRPRDLEGRTVAVNTVNAIGDTIVKASVAADGGDPGTIDFVEVPFPSANAAVLSGEVAAAWQVEPFITLGADQGLRVLTTPLNDAADHDVEVSTYFTTRQVAAEDPELVERFTRAIERSLEYAQENPDAVRDVLPSYLEVTPELADRVILPRWDTEVSRETFELYVDLGQTYGLLQGDVDLDALLTGAGS
ncbi:ABC transporter substrate-binding protein [Georgenia sp. AZ-5]|uniref:ABC transporter substrate-binding protein n=1 Tax=Georgenia sp. AZ-5 TaxID=3367526 RepID=UPI003755132F